MRFTKRIGKMIVPLPLMPLGVEHVALVNHCGSSLYVPLPLMPLGVEHLCRLFAISFFDFVPLPLMPLGVEHATSIISHQFDGHSAFTFDATRR